MTKKMRELQAQILEATQAAKSLVEAGEHEKAAEKLDEADALQKKFDTEARLEKAQKAQVVADTLEPVVETKAADGFVTIAKMVAKKPLSESEKALISGTDAAHGENFLIPEDVKTSINELRKSYISAKSLVTVEVTDSLSGSVNYESGTPAGLTAFDDGDAIVEDTGVTFVKKPFSIAFYGKLIPVSRILAKAERAGLMAYLDRWFVKNAILSENSEIFTALKAGYNSGAPKAIAGWKALKKSINKDLDPSCLIGGVIVTNQSGFAALDEEVDNNGRPILQANPANPTEKLFQGLPIHVFPDAQLSNIDATHFPIFYGNTKAGATFVEHQALEFGFSDSYLFNKNQNCLRVVEGFDVMSTDTSAYIYGSFAATAASSN